MVIYNNLMDNINCALLMVDIFVDHGYLVFVIWFFYIKFKCIVID
jgi:hypothetical protein